jgi:hypothetical protein
MLNSFLFRVPIIGIEGCISYYSYLLFGYSLLLWETDAVVHTSMRNPKK